MEIEIDIKSKKIERVINSVVDLIKDYEIPNINRLVFAESDSNKLIVAVFTENYLNSNRIDKIISSLTSQISNYLGLNPIIIITKDPKLVD